MKIILSPITLLCYFYPTCVLYLSLFCVNASEFDDIKNNTPLTSPAPLFVDADHFNSTNSTSATTTTSIPSDTNVTTSEVEEVTLTPPTRTTSTTATTTKPTTTRTAVTTTTTTPKPKVKKRRSNNRRVCSCDLHFNSCDMNCCCDMDCSKDERRIFSHCLHTDFYEPKIASPDSHSCFRSQIFYRENSPYHIVDTNTGMFCVVTENIERSDQMEEEPKNVDLKFFARKKPKFIWDFVKKMEPDLVWESYLYGSALLKVTGVVDTDPESADVIHIVSTFGLPSSLYSKECTAVEAIKFLVPSETRCRLLIHDLRSDCARNPQFNVNTFIKNTAFISNPGVPNITTDSLVPLVTASCIVLTNGTKFCEPFSPYNEPVYNSRISKCFNVLKSLELTFFHAGIHGLSKVIVKAEFTEVDATVQELVQEFSANFYWRHQYIEEPESREDEKGRSSYESSADDKERETEIVAAGGDGQQNATTKVVVVKPHKDHEEVEIVDWQRSGNPGYIIGKPVLMGTMVLSIPSLPLEGYANETDSNRYSADFGGSNDEDSGTQDKDKVESHAFVKQEQIGIALDKNPNSWMTIHRPGVCDPRGNGYRRKNVLFGMTHQTECLLNVSESTNCGELQSQITQIILGMPNNQFSEKYVSAFGNPDLDDLNEWIPVLMSGFPADLGDGTTSQGCGGIVATLKIKIAFAYVGSINFPQAKIIGVLYEFGESFNVPKKLRCSSGDEDCTNYLHQITVATTVMFVDSTTGPIPKIGQWPVVSIKLPHDFFYPFSATTSRASSFQDTRANIMIPLSLILLFLHYLY